MDRKSLIFISTFSAMLLIVNLFFNRQNIANRQKTSATAERNVSHELQSPHQSFSAASLQVPGGASVETETLKAVQWLNSYVGLAKVGSIPPKLLQMGTAEVTRQCYLEDTGFFLYQAADEEGLAELRIGDFASLKPQDLQGVSADGRSVFKLNWDGHSLQAPDGHVPQAPEGQALKASTDISERALLVFTDAPASLIGIYYPGQARWVSLGEAFRKAHVQLTGITELAPQRAEPVYTLENESLQLVISGRGGGLKEINLPLQGKSHPNSPIKAVEFDHQLARQSPSDIMYPLVSGDSELLISGNDSAPTLLTPHKGGYYPLLRRGSSASERELPAGLEGYSIVSDRPEIAALSYKLVSLSKNRAVLQARSKSSRITKTFSLNAPHKAPYCFEVSVKVEGDATGLWLTSGVPEVELLSGSAAPAVKYQLDRGSSAQIVKMDLPAKTCAVNSIRPNWLCNSNGFFGLITRPLFLDTAGFQIAQVPGEVLPTRLSLIDASWNRFPPSKFPGYQTLTPLPSRPGEYKFQVFAGPLAQRVLSRVDAALGPQSGQPSPNFASCRSFHGWFAFISQPFAQVLMLLMRFFFILTRSWAVSICLLTLALRLMLYPLNTWSLNSTKRMREIAPLMQRIQQTHKKDPQKAQKEILQLYKDHKINPLSGCLPLLLQMPFLIGMFDLLKSSFELRGANFIPGWIDDLSAPDVLLTWGQPLPFFGNELHVLPLLVGIAMYWQQRATSPLAAPSQESPTEQQQQQKAVANIMTVIFTAMFYHFPSGLNLYWLSSILLGLAQQWWIQKNTSQVEVLPAQK